MVGSDDYGRDLTGVQNLKKKHKRVDAELLGHEPNIRAVTDKGQTLMASGQMGKPEILQRVGTLEQSWNALRDVTGGR